MNEKYTDVIFQFGLVDGPAARKIGKAVVHISYPIKHIDGDSQDFARKIEDRQQWFFERGIDEHYQDGGRSRCITISPSQIAYAVAEIAEGQSVDSRAQHRDS